MSDLKDLQKLYDQIGVYELDKFTKGKPMPPSNPDVKFFKPEDFQFFDYAEAKTWSEHAANQANRLLKERGTVVCGRINGDKGWTERRQLPTETESFSKRTHTALLINIQKIDQCEIWPGYKNKNGYGYAYDDLTKKMVLAHRLAYQKHHQVNLSADCVIMHSCDNPSCVKIEHLSAGTQKDNMEDMANKGRRPMGEDHHSAKITLEVAKEIRERYSDGGVSQRRLAEEYRLSQSTIWQILNNEIWIQPIAKEDSAEQLLNELVNYKDWQWQEGKPMLYELIERAKKLLDQK